MAEVARFFDLSSYTESNFAEVVHRLGRDGIVPEAGNKLAMAIIGGPAVTIDTGEAFVQGFWYKNDSLNTLAITANASATPRVDLVVLKLDRTANTLTAFIHQGTIGGGAPTPTQVVGGTWEHVLGSISTASNISTLTDLRDLKYTVENQDDVNAAQDTGIGPGSRRVLTVDPATKTLYWAEAAPSNPNLFRNNLMLINQRGTANRTTSGVLQDRWRFNTGNTSSFIAEAMTVAGPALADAGVHITQTFRIRRLDATALASNGHASILYLPEGTEWQNFYGQPLVMSWWSYSVKSGIFGSALQSSNADRSFSHPFSMPAGVWTFCWYRIPAYSLGTWAFDTSRAAYIVWYAAAGSTFHTASLDTWAASANGVPNTHTNSLVATNDAFYVSAPKLEVGYYPTRLTKIDPDDELANCQRHMERLNNGGNAAMWGMGKAISTTVIDAYWSYKVEKRTLPSSITGSGTFTWDSGAGLGGATFNTVTRNGTWGALVRLTTSGVASGASYPVGFDSAGANWLESSAELS